MNQKIAILMILPMLSLFVMPAISLATTNNQPAIIVSTGAATVFPGKYFELNLKIRNEGNLDAYNIMLTITTDNVNILPVSKSTEFIQRLNSNIETNRTFRFIVDSSAEEAVYPITIKLTYNDIDGNNYSSTTTISVNVIDNKNPYIKIFYVSLKPEAYASGTSELTIDAANIGSEKAYSAVIKAETPAGIIKRNSFYVGDLNTDDFSTIDLEIKFNPEDNGSYPVNFDIYYRDKNNKEITSSESFNITVRSLEEYTANKPKPLPILEALAIFIVIIIIIWFIRKRLRKK